MWILLIVVAFVIYKAFSFKEQVMQKQVDSYGGMQNKYSTLVKAFLSDTRSRIVQVLRDEITIRIEGDFGVSETYTIKEAPQTTHIFWECDWQHLGKHKNVWKFPDTMSQDIMLSEIQKFMSDRFNHFNL